MNAQKIIKRLIYVFIVILILLAIRSFSLYHKAFMPNIVVSNDDKINYLYIPTGSNYDDVLEIIKKKNLVKDLESFEWTAKKKKYKDHIFPGRYKIKDRMSNNELVNKLRSGRQDPLRVTFNNIRTLEELSKKIAAQLEINSSRLLDLMNSIPIQSKYGFNEHTMICMFVPNTYEFYWNTSEEKFLDRMFEEYNDFWNRSRILKSESMKMTKEEIITLASIVDEETKKDSEKPTVAGVYINRLKKGIRLQADPTIIYAIGNFSIKRVLKKQYEIDSPYNTYMHDGLPPGPICIPEISSIEAVLNYEDHDYLYFCAKPDFSGYHNFAKTLEQHNRNAELYRRELNRMRVYH
jgi:UPF0755 protein